jgi:hypothetical protein
MGAGDWIGDATGPIKLMATPVVKNGPHGRLLNVVDRVEAFDSVRFDLCCDRGIRISQRFAISLAEESSKNKFFILI